MTATRARNRPPTTAILTDPPGCGAIEQASFQRRRESSLSLPACGIPVRPNESASDAVRQIPASGDLYTTRWSSCLGMLCLLHLPRCAGAEDRGACGDEEAAGKEEQEQQAAGYAGAARSGELVQRNGRRCGCGRGRWHRRASWGHRWRRCGCGRHGIRDVIRAGHGDRWRRSASRQRGCLRCWSVGRRRGCLWGRSVSRYKPGWWR